MGDSNLPPAPVAGGSNSTASVCNVVAKACEDIRARVADAAVKAKEGLFSGASFVEVRVHAMTGEVRTPRILGAYAFGRVVNPKAAQSKLMGGQIWGVSCALHEATEIDRRDAKYTDTDLAEYLIPVNADIVLPEAIILPQVDTEVNELGIKGVGELGNVGMNAAVANAVFHATGVRVRELPIRLEKLFGGEPSAKV